MAYSEDAYNNSAYNKNLGKTNQAKGYWDWMADPKREGYEAGDVANAQQSTRDANVARGMNPDGTFTPLPAYDENAQLALAAQRNAAPPALGGLQTAAQTGSPTALSAAATAAVGGNTTPNPVAQQPLQPMGVAQATPHIGGNQQKFRTKSSLAGLRRASRTTG